ncbi:MAG: hypothetical protein LBF87_01475 [Treponema sp.]|nr:hypothetical protein [Treponema sp.]
MGTVDLKEIRCFEHERTISNGSGVRFVRRLFQVLNTNTALPRPRDKVTVWVRLDGTYTILWKEKPFLIEEIALDKNDRPSLAVREPDGTFLLVVDTYLYLS